MVLSQSPPEASSAAARLTWRLPIPAANSVSLLQGDGQGGFRSCRSSNWEARSSAVVATGDFTGDGRTDLAIASQSPNSVVVELNQGSGQFAQPGSVGLVLHDTPLMADLNGDGVSDVAIVDGTGDILFDKACRTSREDSRPPVTVNPGHPSRNIAYLSTPFRPRARRRGCPTTTRSRFMFIAGSFDLVGSIATGLLPAQIITGDLNGEGGTTWWFAMPATAP